MLGFDGVDFFVILEYLMISLLWKSWIDFGILLMLLGDCIVLVCFVVVDVVFECVVCECVCKLKCWF